MVEPIGVTKNCRLPVPRSRRSGRQWIVEFPLVRRLISALTVAAGIPAFLAVPVLSLPGVHPHAVAPAVESVAVPAAQGPHHVLAHVERPRAHPFELVGATWRTGTLDPGAAVVQVRVHQPDGWSSWASLAPQDGGADGGSADA